MGKAKIEKYGKNRIIVLIFFQMIYLATPNIHKKLKTLAQTEVEIYVIE